MGLADGGEPSRLGGCRRGRTRPGGGRHQLAAVAGDTPEAAADLIRVAPGPGRHHSARVVPGGTGGAAASAQTATLARASGRLGVDADRGRRGTAPVRRGVAGPRRDSRGGRPRRAAGRGDGQRPACRLNRRCRFDPPLCENCRAQLASDTDRPPGGPDRRARRRRARFRPAGP